MWESRTEDLEGLKLGYRAALHRNGNEYYGQPKKKYNTNKLVK